MCSIFAGLPAPTVASGLREVMAAAGASVDDRSASTDNPIQVLRLVAERGDDDLTRIVATALRESEMAAVETAEPTPHVDEVIAAARASGRRLAIVSNNSHEAVTTYLARRGLLSTFAV